MANALGRAGYPTEVVDCAEDALERIRKGGYDLVISDLRLPGMNGPDLASRIYGISGKIPVILIGAREELGVGGIDSSCPDYFIEKPFNLNEIVAIVGAILKSTDSKMIKLNSSKT